MEIQTSKLVKFLLYRDPEIEKDMDRILRHFLVRTLSLINDAAEFGTEIQSLADDALDVIPDAWLNEAVDFFEALDNLPENTYYKDGPDQGSTGAEEDQ